MKADFSKKTIAALAKKGITVTGSQAVPGFEGDKYFTGVAYKLVWNDVSFMRTYQQVITISRSSWDPATDLDISETTTTKA